MLASGWATENVMLFSFVVYGQLEYKYITDWLEL